jgi:putative spermidine/putrescine transport system substrate-binding protein
MNRFSKAEAAGWEGRMSAWYRWFGYTAVVTLVAVACTGGADTGGGDGDEEVTLTFVSFGGAYQEAQTKGWLEPFMAEHPNITIVQEEPTDYAKLQAMVESGNVTWDVVDVGNDFGLASDEDILEPIDCTLVPCDELQPDVFQTTGYRVPDIIYSVVLAYRTDAFEGDAPTTFADFFDLETYPGKRSAWNFPSSGLLEMALIADGVAPDQLYPLDLDRAFAKLDTIKDQIVWWDTGSQSAQLLADGETVFGQSWNGRIFDIQQQDAPVEVMWSQHLLTADFLVIPKGSQHVEEAQELIAYATSAENNAAVSQYIAYAPPNENAVENVDQSKKAELPTTHADTGVGFDDIWWDENFDRVDQLWQEWVQA